MSWPEAVELLGEEQARILCSHFGRKTTYVPLFDSKYKNFKKDAETTKKIIDAVGENISQAVLSQYAGKWLYIPTSTYLEWNLLSSRISEDAAKRIHAAFKGKHIIVPSKKSLEKLLQLKNAIDGDIIMLREIANKLHGGRVYISTGDKDKLDNMTANKKRRELFFDIIGSKLTQRISLCFAGTFLQLPQGKLQLFELLSDDEYLNFAGTYLVNAMVPIEFRRSVYKKTKIMEMLIKDFGLEVALKLCNKFGGGYLVVPSSRKKNKFAEILNDDAYKKLCKWCGGTHISFSKPLKETLKEKILNRLMNSEDSPSQIARNLNCSYDYVYKFMNAYPRKYKVSYENRWGRDIKSKILTCLKNGETSPTKIAHYAECHISSVCRIKSRWLTENKRAVCDLA
jgi:hypothetical protein